MKSQAARSNVIRVPKFESRKKLAPPKSQYVSVRSWSPGRPDKSQLEDQLAQELFARLSKIESSSWYMADISGLSEHTINAYRNMRVKRPQGLSLQMLADSLGYQIKLVPKKKG